MPEEVLDRAKVVLTELETRHLHGSDRAGPARKRRRELAPQPGLFTDLEFVEDRADEKEY